MLVDEKFPEFPLTLHKDFLIFLDRYVVRESLDLLCAIRRSWIHKIWDCACFFYSICKKVNVLRWKEAANVLVLKSFVAKNFNYHSNVEIHVPGVHIKK